MDEHLLRVSTDRRELACPRLRRDAPKGVTESDKHNIDGGLSEKSCIGAAAVFSERVTDSALPLLYTGLLVSTQNRIKNAPVSFLRVPATGEKSVVLYPIQFLRR